MADRSGRRQFLVGIAGLGTVAIGGCAARAPSGGSEATPSEETAPGNSSSEQTPSGETPTGEDGRQSLPELGSDMETDTSGDGIPDLLVERIDAVEGLDPYRKNVLVEVDPVIGVEYRESLAFARSVFADAPVENPDGSTGIDVHFVVDDPIPRADTSAFVQRDYHFGRYDTSVFDRRHRGFRHLVLLDSLSPDDWYADRFFMATEADRGGRLVDVLAAHVAGRFDPLVADAADARDADADAQDADADTTDTQGEDTGPLWLPDREDPTADALLAAIDWELLAENLPKAAPSTWWYERKYAHLAEGSEESAPDATEADLGPAVGEPDKDTSGDGIPDRLLLNADVFEGASPLRKNVFVEVDHTTGVPRQVVEQRMREIEAVFADAPVRNPDGSMGIDVHYVIEDAIEVEGVIDAGSADEFRTEHFDRLLKGYYYMVFVPNLENVAGRASHQGEILFTEPRPSTPLHELGHALGLYATRPGVDQRRYPFEEYPSAMNYNAPPHALVFADDTAHPVAPNDWAVIERLLSEDRPPISLL
jgi:hypothetical protein